MQVLPWAGRSPGGGDATHSSTLAWRVPWTEQRSLADCSPWVAKSQAQLKLLSMQAYIFNTFNVLPNFLSSRSLTECNFTLSVKTWI